MDSFWNGIIFLNGLKCNAHLAVFGSIIFIGGREGRFIKWSLMVEANNVTYNSTLYSWIP